MLSQPKIDHPKVTIISQYIVKMKRSMMKYPMQRIGDYSYSLSEVLGQGSFSTVYSGRSLHTGQKVAIKVVNLRIPQHQQLLKNLKNEIYVLKALPAHPNILKFIYLQQKGPNVFIVTEMCEENLTTCKNIDINVISTGIIRGLKHLWKHGVVHRDIKLENVMVKNGQAKIIDFGFAKVISDPCDIMVEQLGTPLYMSPQLLQKKFYTSKCDIWSLGVLLYQLLYKHSPFPAGSLNQLISKVKSSSPIIYKGYNTVIQRLIEQCLVKDQSRRLSWVELFRIADQLVKTPVKQPETVYQYIAQWTESYSGIGCWPTTQRRSSMF